MKYKIEYWYSLFFLIISFLFLVYLVPPNMDEFLPYHRIACEYYEFNSQNIFREKCTDHQSKFFGIEFYRNYNYVGISSSIIYAPFFYLSKTIYSHYFFSFFVFLIFSFIFTKVFRFKLILFIIPLFYFPLQFQMIHDTGPIKIAIISWILIIYAISKILEANKKIFFFYLILVLSIFFSIEDKTFIIFIFPQILFISILFFFCESNKSNYSKLFNKYKIYKFLKQNFNKILLILSIFIILIILLLLFYKVRFEDAYISYYQLLLNDKSLNLSFHKELLYILAYSISPILFSSKIYQLSYFEILLSSFVLCLLFFLIFKPKNFKKIQIKYKILFFSYFITIIVFLIFRKTWTGHHFIFLHLPIILGFCIYANKNRINLLKTLIFLTTIILFTFAQLSFAKIYDYSDKSRNAIFKKLKEPYLANNSVINFSTWGGYYIQSLYGDEKQLVTYTDQLDIGHSEKLKKIKLNNNRKYIINVCFDENINNKCTYDFLKNKFVNFKTIKPLIDNTGIWRAWIIY